MFNKLGKALDRELDEIVPMLLKKAGEVSNAGVGSVRRMIAVHVILFKWRGREVKKQY